MKRQRQKEVLPGGGDITGKVYRVIRYEASMRRNRKPQRPLALGEEAF